MRATRTHSSRQPASQYSDNIEYCTAANDMAYTPRQTGETDNSHAVTRTISHHGFTVSSSVLAVEQSLQLTVAVNRRTEYRTKNASE